MASSGAIPEESSVRLREGEYLSDDDFQALCASEVSSFGKHLIVKIVTDAMWQCVTGCVATVLCKAVDTYCTAHLQYLPDMGDGSRGALAFVIMASNVRSSTLSNFLGLPKWFLISSPIEAARTMDEGAISAFCSNCNPLHLLGWEVAYWSIPNAVPLRYFVATIALGYAGAYYQLTFPFAHRGGAYNGSLFAFLVR